MHNEESTEAAPPRGPAIWRLDLRSGELRSSDARALMMGYELSAVEPTAQWWDRMVHPDERVAVAMARSRHLLGLDSGYRSEYRAQHKDGTWRWLLEVGCIARDETGKAQQLEGVVLDITVDREAQFRLQQRLERLNTIFDYTHQFTALLSPDGGVLEINRAALTPANVLRSAVLGRPVWESPLSGRHPPALMARHRDSVARAAGGEVVHFQMHAERSQKDKRIVDISLVPIFDDYGAVISILSEGRDVTDIVSAQQALRTVEDRLALAATTANLGLWEIDLRTGDVWHNDRYWTMLGYQPNEISTGVEQWLALTHPDDAPTLRALVAGQRANPGEFRVDYRMRAKDGSWRWVHASGRAVVSAEPDSEQRIAGVQLDVTERREAEIRMQSSERLESVGKLAAGVAHEINTPVQFVSDSIYFVRDGLHELLALSDRMRTIAARDPGNLPAVQALSSNLPYLIENLPKALERSLDGLKRVSEIVSSMRELAHPDRPEMSEIDVNHIIETALVVARSEYKYVADTETDFGALPPVWCHAGELNQVIINLLINASHAIADVLAGSDNKGLIRVSTRMEGERVLISVADNGAGIPEDIRHRVFDPFFTTKEVGRGTGQGLAISRNIIVKRHGGSIDFDSTPGRGTVFTVRLPRDCRSEPMPASSEIAA